MRKPIVIIVSLLLAGLMVGSACAFSFPTGLTGLSGLSGLSSGSPTTSSLLGSSGVPTSNLGVSTPTTPFGDSSWALNGLSFFQPSRATPQTTSSTGTGIPASDANAIMQMLGQLPSPEEVQQSANPTPTPTPVDTFTAAVTGQIPDGQVLFLDVSKNILYTDASAGGFKLPSVSMNYQFDSKNRKLILKNKNGTDYASAKIIVGYTRQNDVDGSYMFDYNLGSVPYDDIPIVFTGSDGRVRITLNGTQKDLMPNEKAESSSTSGNLMTSITVTNYGLIPVSNIEVKDQL